MAKYMDVQHGFAGVPEDQPREAHEGDLAVEERRRAFRARLHRQRTGTSGAGRSPLRWLPAWLRPGRGGIMRLPRPGAEGKRVVLRDGSEVLIRQVQRADAPLLADGFARLSTKSRQMRFLTPKKELSPSELRYLTDIDHHDHEALGALSHPQGRGVGIARYIRNAQDPQAADIAVTIVDDWQGRGLGTELLAQLSDRARQEGIRRFTALVAADNAAVLGLLSNANASLVGREFGTLEYEIPLAPAEDRGSGRPDPRILDEAGEELSPVVFDLAPSP
jgi:RimJ/RimL family protein N-acetyltransferase